MENDFTVFISNKNSTERYKSNTVSEFTNIINPVIKFDDSTKWSVSLKSLILPFKYDANREHVTSPKEYEIVWEYFTSIPRNNNIENSNIKRTKISVKISSRELINKSATEIFNYIKTKTVSSKSHNRLSSRVFNAIFILGDNRLILNRILRKKVADNGIYSTLLKINVYFGKHTQNLLGFKSTKYNVFDIDNTLNEDHKIIPIVGNKDINIKFEIPDFIYIYSDLIKPVRFGSKFIQILDILPLEELTNIEKKHNELIYHDILKEFIDEISIKITDSSHEILINHSEDIILCLHFKKKHI